MKIKVSKTACEMAKEIALEWAAGNREIPDYKDGFSVLRCRDFPEIDAEWGRSDFPFGREAWEGKLAYFPEYVETDVESVHHGEKLPKGGVGVISTPIGALVMRQWVYDEGYWFWRWEPLVLVVNPN